MAIACFGIGAILGNGLGGWLTDRIGRRHTIVAGAFCSAATLAGIYAAPTLPLIMLSVILNGASNATYHPASSALLADLVPEHQRVRAYSTLRLALNAGFAAGSACAGFLAFRGPGGGASGQPDSFFWLFAGDVLTTCVFALIALTMLPHGLRSRGEKAPWSEALAALRGHSAFHALAFGTLCLGLITTQFGVTYPLHVLHVAPSFTFGPWHFQDTQVYGLLLAWNGLLVVVAELPLTGFILRFHPRHVLALGYALHGFGFAANAFCHGFPSLFVAMTILTFGEMAVAPVSSAYLARIAPEQMRGRYMGLLSIAHSISAILGPLYGTRLLAFNPIAFWSAIALLGLVGSAAILLVRSRKAHEPLVEITPA
jgi:MFS family permease